MLYNNKNETYYRSERNLFLTIWIYFNYLNLFLTIWIYFYPFLSIGIYFYRFEYISIYLNLFIVPLVLSTWGKHLTNIRPTEIISTNIRPMLVKHQIDIIQASDNYQTNFSILQYFKSRIEIFCILDKLHVFPWNSEQYLTISSISEYVLQYLYHIIIFYDIWYCYIISPNIHLKISSKFRLFKSVNIWKCLTISSNIWQYLSIPSNIW